MSDSSFVNLAQSLINILNHRNSQLPIQKGIPCETFSKAKTIIPLQYKKQLIVLQILNALKNRGETSMFDFCQFS